MRPSSLRLPHQEEAIRQAERSRIARDLHDDLGGNLIAIKMALAQLMARLPADPPQLGEKAGYIDALVDRTIESVHRISAGLRPSVLDLGIVAALAWQAREFEQQTDIPVDMHMPDENLALEPDHANALFHIHQEALTNIAKHAGATRVTVTLQKEGDALTLAICDNGRGIDAPDRLKPESCGLPGMTERVQALGGTLALSAAPGGGTMVTIKTSLAPPAVRAREQEPE
jgi:two-component system sensor histidine kinase UhpB